jgi:hypothetical protein
MISFDQSDCSYTFQDPSLFPHKLAQDQSVYGNFVGHFQHMYIHVCAFQCKQTGCILISLWQKTLFYSGGVSGKSVGEVSLSRSFIWRFGCLLFLVKMP